MPSKVSMAGFGLSKAQLAEWVFRLAVLVGLLYLSSNYVSSKDYKIDEARKAQVEETKATLLNTINITLARIDERLKLDDTKPRLQKLEDQVNKLEKRVP